MTEQRILICYACNVIIPNDTPMHEAIRVERQRSGRERRFDDHAVRCPRHDNTTYHPPNTGYNWVSKATRRGRDLLRRLNADEARRQAEAEADSVE